MTWGLRPSQPAALIPSVAIALALYKKGRAK
jgi:hypothetical protein